MSVRVSKQAMTREPEIYPPDVLAEEEPKYLRRQKPVEVRRRKFGKQQRATYLWFLVAGLSVLATAVVAYVAADFALSSPYFRLSRPEQIEVRGNVQVRREAVLERFSSDLGRSTLRVPLEQRRAALEQIPWVARARVERILPDRIRVTIEERKPVAFLRQGADLALIDAHGVVLDRPLKAEFQFPVVAGLDAASAPELREARMKMFMDFLADVERVEPGATAYVSEVDLAEADNLSATLAGMPQFGNPATGGQESVLVHFGNQDFEHKFRQFRENIAQWRAAAGRVESVDLRYERQVVVNPEAPVEQAQGPAAAPEKPAAKPAPKRER
jgi:cell division protein FtsQ